MARDLPSRNLPIIRHANFVRNVSIGKLLFGLANKRNLRDRVNPVPVTRGIGLHRRPELPRRRDGSLLHRDRRQALKTNGAAYPTNAPLGRPALSVRLDAPSA